MNREPIVAVFTFIEMLAHIELLCITKLFVKEEIGDSFYVVTQHARTSRD
ncbi:MAG TPA: hypothetical protein VNM92_10470 [Thermoanaerobaculia bacterium]|nr:hypothetical protein [Thermoanaerobaculia bacterium]